MNKYVSIGKQDQGSINEDAAIANDCFVAVSDGAGGGGLFADRWSYYLLKHLPVCPFSSAEDMDNWLGTIWEPFYNKCEADAKKLDSMLLNKFYDEGSYATLAAIWHLSDTHSKWVTYGDSVAFHYNYRTKILEHSFGHLEDFNNSPYLINCKDELNKDGYRSGSFITDDNSVVFVATDALSHYIIMMYEISHKDNKDIITIKTGQTKNDSYINIALAMRHIDFEKDVLIKLINSMNNKVNFQRHTTRLVSQGLLAIDDYSMSIFQN